MKRVGVDLRHVPTDGTPGAGVAHASNELAEALQRLGPEYGIQIVPIRGKIRSWELALILRREGVQELFCASGAVPPFVGVPFYPWVHDVAIFRHPEWFPQSRLRRLLTTHLFLKGVRRAAHVFAVSKDAKRSLVDVARIPESGVTVTYQGMSFAPRSERSLPHAQKHYALILGTIEPRKNIPFIFNLWDEVRRRFGDVKLVIAGSKGWGHVMSRNTRLSSPNVEWVAQPSDAERDSLIAGASVLLLPSFYEGFGRPALEAMASGVPVIASRRGAIPEVVGEAGVLLDPTDREAWTSNIVRAFSGELDGLRGKAQAARFTWEKTARIILAKIAEIG